MDKLFKLIYEDFLIRRGKMSIETNGKNILLKIKISNPDMSWFIDFKT